MRKVCFGISRSRDKKGIIVKQELKPYTMCIHTNVGGGYETMQVLIAEKIYYERKTDKVAY